MKRAVLAVLTIALIGLSRASAAEKDMQGTTLIDRWQISPGVVVQKSGDIAPWTVILPGEKRHGQIAVKRPMPGQLIGLNVH